MAGLARQNQIHFEWWSEIECAHYFRRGSELHRVLPDGEGVWHQGEESFRFLVEMDRTRESPQNLRAKFDEYFQWQIWRHAKSRWESDPDLLFVTTGWTQAHVIMQVMQERSYGVLPLYPLWVTTFESVARHGIEGWIWQSPEGEGFFRLPCFVHGTNE